jgi:hypothetical protein
MTNFFKSLARPETARHRRLDPLVGRVEAAGAAGGMRKNDK